jgi:hypothetical protein
MTFGKIDDPWKASREAWPVEHDSGPAEAALALSGLLGPVFEIAEAARESFRSANRMRRIEYFFKALDLKFKELDNRFGSNDAELSKIKERIASREFSDAVQMAAEESVRAVPPGKIDRFAAVLAGSVTPNQWAHPNQDIATMIRDLAQLGDRDIQVLDMLATVHASAISHAPNLQSPDSFSKETPALKRAIASSGIHPDDFLSTCERLRGFGLAADVLRNNSHMGPEDFCYRPTRRGLTLLEYLKK